MYYHYAISRFDTAVIIGALGHLGTWRLTPALTRLVSEGKVRRIIEVDIKPESYASLHSKAFTGASYTYYQVAEGCVLENGPITALTAIGNKTVAYVACPSEYHVLYADMLRKTGCRIAVEKPLARDQLAAETMTDWDYSCLYAVGHQLFKKEMVKALREIDSVGPQKAEGFEFNLLETSGIGERAIDNAIWDTGWHGFEVFLAMFRAAGLSAKFLISEVQTAIYEAGNGEPCPTKHTAARIDGYLIFKEYTIPFTIRVGKGLSFELKELVIWERHNSVRRVIPLSESGWEAHYRILNELICAEMPDMKLSLNDVVTIVQACSEADKRAVDQGTYAFGQTPDFLLGGCVSLPYAAA